VVAAHAEGRDDWLQVASSNGIPASTAYDLIRRNRAEDLPWGGARSVKMTQAAKGLLEKYLNEDCTYTLDTMRTMLFLDCGVRADTSTISRL
jgi:transposase